MPFTEFFVTPGSSASINNGGGPGLGTNDGPVDTNADCSTNPGGTTITSSAGSWANSAVGDWVNFDPAVTADRARITDIAGAVLTVTPAVTGSASSKTCNVGGAFDKVQDALDAIDRATTDFRNAAGDQIRINIKSGTYDETIDIDTNNGLLTDYILLQGYGTNPGDNPTSRPTITNTTTDGVATIKWTGATLYYEFRDLIFDNTPTAPLATLWVNGARYAIFRRCHIKGKFSDGLIFSANYCVFYDCELEHQGTGYCFNETEVLTLIGCEIHGGNNATYGNGRVGSANRFEFCVFRDTVAGPGVYHELATRKNSHFNGCLFYNNATDGLKCNAEVISVVNCGFVDNGGYGINVIGGTVAGKNNGFHANTSGDVTGDYNSENDVLDPNDPRFASPASPPSDFSLGIDSPWKAAGFPGTIQSGRWTGSLDIGPAQRKEPASVKLAGDGGGLVG